MKLKFDETAIRETLRRSWSVKSAKQWSESRPFDGQCNVTSIVVAEFFDAEIRKTPWNELTDHYYNFVAGERHDFTDKQFEHPVEYRDIPASPDEVRDTIPAAEIVELKRAFLANWKGGEHDHK